MNEDDFNIELIANIEDIRFAIVEYELMVATQPPQQQKNRSTAVARIKIVDETQFRTIELSDKGYRETGLISGDHGGESDWFETLSTLLQERSESFQNQMMKTLFAKLNNLEQQ
jgi:hypothetical protein